jgi:hypothetical protein
VGADIAALNRKRELERLAFGHKTSGKLYHDQLFEAAEYSH